MQNIKINVAVYYLKGKKSGDIQKVNSKLLYYYNNFILHLRKKVS